MHFGRVSSVKDLDLSIPADGPRTTGFLRYLQKEGFPPGQLFVGAPIWGEAVWKGVLYPESARPSQYLRYYAQHYPTVELNASFYSLPTLAQVASWRHDVGPEFRFCPKMPKDLSHKLHALDDNLLRDYIAVLEAFGSHLGTSFMQLPEWFEARDFPRLEAFLDGWEKDWPLTIEFRHPSWFEGSQLKDPVINFLFRKGLGTVITDTPGERHVLHTSLTAPRVLVRFQGNFPSPTDQERLRVWCDRLMAWGREGLSEAYLCIHQERHAGIPLTVDYAIRYLFDKHYAGLIRPDAPSEDEEEDFHLRN